MQFDDFMWLQFSDEPQVRWDDIKLRGQSNGVVKNVR